MQKKQVDYLIIGPAHPYRGGIAETNHELALAFKKNNKKVQIWTFKKLYFNFLFPGKTQFSDQSAPKELDIKRVIHAYSPFEWNNVIKKIKKLNPKNVIFRYYTPFLALCYGYLARNISSKINCIGMVDNWIPHENTFLDNYLSKFFGSSCISFVTLSKSVANEIENNFNKPILKGFHPINEFLPKPISKKIARKNLNLSNKIKYILFFGLIRKYKGLDLLIEAFSIYQKLNTNTQLLIVGEFYEKKNKYIKQINDLGLENKIRLYPEFIDSIKARDFFCAADCVAQTYKSASQSGVTPVAYHYNLPVLVTKIDGLSNPIVNDESGVITEIDSNSIAKGLIEILKTDYNIKFRKKIKSSRENYSWKKFNQEMINFIE
tara:strand:- start:719 stop:1849 length:1131 start_codon:yes stop_codon:yes gene_type:complete